LNKLLSDEKTKLFDLIFILGYKQPNYASVELKINIKNVEVNYKADYCPSSSGCRKLIDFNSIEKLADLEEASFTVKLLNTNQSIWIDYLLVMPGMYVSPDIAYYSPVDLSDRFKSDCLDRDYFKTISKEDNVNKWKFCERIEFAISAKYNSGATACECHPNGTKASLLLECAPLGGQCSCKPNIIGRQCTECKTGYWGFPECKKCECGECQACDQTSGACSTLPNTTNCECTRGHWNLNLVYGCEECACNPNGTVGNSVDRCLAASGQCECMEHRGGRQCNKCMNGYYGYPTCSKCNCESAGVETSICDQQSGACTCKKAVEGERCDKCKPGSFDLKSLRKEGCIKCWCSGTTQNCNSARLFRRQVRDMNHKAWRLSLEKIGSLSMSIDENELKLNYSNHSEDLKIKKAIYWLAPASYLGNRLTSYGGRLHYAIRIGQPAFAADASALIKPELVLVGANLTLLHMLNRSAPIVGERFENTIDLIESEFRTANSPSDAALVPLASINSKSSATRRDQLMAVLASLTNIKLRALYYDRPHTSELLEFTMEEATEFENATANDQLSITSNIENCTCESTHRGYSCEECIDGYFRIYSPSGVLSCQKCNCNNRTDTCDQQTGICKCPKRFAGANCEQCAPGYQGQDCQNCQAGHYSHTSENGTLDESECRACNCSGNIDIKYLC
jgi:laminin, alpha 3/5